MLYKLYIQKFKEGSFGDYKLFADIAKIYRENGVIVLGHWINKKQPSETILITIYRDVDHYNEFTTKMKQDPDYQQRQNLLSEVRESLEVKDLMVNKHSLLKPSDDELLEYITDVKSMIEDYS